ncbi:hypothetical protein PENTCL1PPCAC_13675, partial [Pristionchus entomophagus]
EDAKQLSISGYFGDCLDMNAFTNWLIDGKVNTIQIAADGVFDTLGYDFIEKYANAVTNPSLNLTERGTDHAHYTPLSESELAVISTFTDFEVLDMGIVTNAFMALINMRCNKIRAGKWRLLTGGTIDWATIVTGLKPTMEVST